MDGSVVINVFLTIFRFPSINFVSFAERNRIVEMHGRYGWEEDCVFPCVCFKLTKNLGKISYLFEFICTVIFAENINILCKI